MKIFVKQILVSLLVFTIYTSSNVFANNSSAKFNNDQEELYRHLGKNIKYPAKASAAEIQGNNVILFSVVAGKLQDLKIETSLGFGCDIEVLNTILSFTKIKNIKPGKYALTTTFKLDGSEKTMKNETVVIPEGYTALNLTIVGYHSIEDKMTTPNQSKNGTNQFKFYLGDNEPLYILDNEVFTADKKTILPEMIESITVLKDLTAISKYGDQGKNGVIIITSKAAAKKQALQKAKDKQNR